MPFGVVVAGGVSSWLGRGAGSSHRVPFGVFGGGIVCGFVIGGVSSWAAASISSQSMPRDCARTGVPGVVVVVIAGLWVQSAAAF